MLGYCYLPERLYDEDINGTCKVVMVDASNEPDNVEDEGALKNEAVDKIKISFT